MRYPRQEPLRTLRPPRPPEQAPAKEAGQTPEQPPEQAPAKEETKAEKPAKKG